ncbi:T9SS type A sorting domain-containing protein, partial [Psychroserpens sp.]|uniref:T9SS type A sorting domain-containing protein n=1 Tax=Psychroserpens sp. TaxID=2020870 RepID=UPI003C774A32
NGDIGNSSNSNSSRIYFNNGDFSFSENTGIVFPSVGSQSNFVSADYTGNGELDFLISGRLQPYTELLFSTSIFENSGNLSLFENTTTGIFNYSFNDIEIGDFDNDNDVDVFVIKSDLSNIYTNQSMIQNTAPSSPLNLNTTVMNSDVVLNWSAATDNESPTEQLTYNLYVGTAIGTTDIMSPMSDLNSGYRKVVGIGNSQYKNQAVLKNLPNGTYYWAVQSIDNQYQGSTFSTEQTFTINNLNTDEFETNLSVQYYPNPVKTYLTISSTHFIERVTINTVLGEILNTSSSGNLKDFEIDLTNYNTGIYFINLQSGYGAKMIKIMKE